MHKTAKKVKKDLTLVDKQANSLKNMQKCNFHAC